MVHATNCNPNHSSWAKGICSSQQFLIQGIRRNIKKFTIKCVFPYTDLLGQYFFWAPFGCFIKADYVPWHDHFSPLSNRLDSKLFLNLPLWDKWQLKSENSWYSLTDCFSFQRNSAKVSCSKQFPSDKVT